MKTAIIVFPGSNRERDMAYAVAKISGNKPTMVWHGENNLPQTDLIVIPGGFSYGDYLRSGAIAARSPIMNAIIKQANSGVPTLGICNGFQILTEAGLLPGVLMRNAGIKFICRDIYLRVERNDLPFTNAYNKYQIIKVPIAHHDGNFFAQENVISNLEDNNQIVVRYCDSEGNIDMQTNPNGSIHNIAGITNKSGNILGMMPHPENLIEPIQGGTDGKGFFESIIRTVTHA